MSKIIFLQRNTLFFFCLRTVAFPLSVSYRRVCSRARATDFYGSKTGPRSLQGDRKKKKKRFYLRYEQNSRQCLIKATCSDNYARRHEAINKKKKKEEKNQEICLPVIKYRQRGLGSSNANFVPWTRDGVTCRLSLTRRRLAEWIKLLFIPRLCPRRLWLELKTG